MNNNKCGNIEMMYIESLKVGFKQLPDGKWQKKEGIGQYSFICPDNKQPWEEWISRYPSAYKEELNCFFDEVHPY